MTRRAGAKFPSKPTILFGFTPLAGCVQSHPAAPRYRLGHDVAGAGARGFARRLRFLRLTRAAAHGRHRDVTRLRRRRRRR